MNPIRHVPTPVATTNRTAAPARRRRRAAAAAALIPLVAASAAGSAAADPPSDGAGCAPVACAAEYIGGPTNTLLSLVLERQRDQGGLGFGVVLDTLDAAEQTKLAALPHPTEFNIFQVRQIMRDHDELEHLILGYAVSGLLPPQ